MVALQRRLKLALSGSGTFILALGVLEAAVVGLVILMNVPASAQTQATRPTIPGPYKLLSYQEVDGGAQAVLFVPNDTDSKDDILAIQTLARSITRLGKIFDLTVCFISDRSPFENALSCSGEFIFQP